MLQVVLTTGEVVDIDSDAVTFAGPWAEFTRGPIPVASVSAEGVVRIELPSDAADRRRTTIGVSVKAWQPWTEEDDADLPVALFPTHLARARWDAQSRQDTVLSRRPHHRGCPAFSM